MEMQRQSAFTIILQSTNRRDANRCWVVSKFKEYAGATAVAKIIVTVIVH